MSYHYSSSHVSKRHVLNRIIWVVLLLLIGVSSALGFYYRQPIADGLQPVLTSMQQIKTWLMLQKTTLSQTVASTSAMTDKTKPVHFEFYSALSDAEVSVPPPVNNQRDKKIQTADNAKGTLSPLVFSRDELVKEFEEKLDENTIDRRVRE